MVKVLVLFGVPEDVKAFENHFEQRHLPLLRKVHLLKEVVVNKIAGATEGTAPYHQIVELHFASEKQMYEGLNSEAGQSVAKDLSDFTQGKFQILFSRVEQI